MIKSNFKTYNFILVVVLIGYFIFILWMLYILDTRYYHYGFPLVYDKSIPFKGMKNSEVILINIFFIPMVALIIRLIITEPMMITIDLETQTIQYKNIITRHATTFSFDSFDGYIETTQKSRRGEYQVYYLIRNKKVVEKIKGYYFKNIEELKNGIDTLKNLGTQKINFIKRFKILLNQPILD